jgi:acetyl esterase/lipase
MPHCRSYSHVSALLVMLVACLPSAAETTGGEASTSTSQGEASTSPPTTSSGEQPTETSSGALTTGPETSTGAMNTDGTTSSASTSTSTSTSASTSASTTDAESTTGPGGTTGGVLCEGGAGSEGPEIVPGVQAAACDPATYTVQKNLAYAPGDSHGLDLYRPKGAGPFPTVVWIHGGGWKSGSKADVQQALRLVCRGYAVASIDYRLSGVAVFPAQIQDVKAAIRFLRANAGTYDLDPQRFASFGSSAGGHLSALAGVASDIEAFDDPNLGDVQVSAAVQAMVVWYGPSDLAAMDPQLIDQGCAPGSAKHGLPDSAESQLLGCTVAEPACAAAVAAAAPQTYVDASDPPALLLHGAEDCIVPFEQSATLFTVLVDAGVCAEYRKVTGTAHGGPNWQSGPVQDVVAAYLDQRFLGP